MSLRLPQLGEHLAPVVLAFVLSIAVSTFATPKEKVLHSFLNCSADACAPGAALVFDRAGHLYGTAGGGGQYTGAGTVYTLTQNGREWDELVIYTFTEPDGCSPSAPLIGSRSGALYSTTTCGGTHDAGTVFQLTPGSSGWAETVLYSFCSQGGGYCTDGEDPFAGLVMDKAGNLFGVTRDGGYNGVGGVAFELTPDSSGWTENTIFTFGQNPSGGGVNYFAPILDASGNLYGSDPAGGDPICECGAVYELTPGSGGWNEQVLYTFKGTYNDGNPYGGLVFDPQGNLYGTTSKGGPSAQGTVFKLAPDGQGGWKHTVLYTFPNEPNGAYPQGTLVMDKAGALYGIAGGGNSNDYCGDACGVVYKLSPRPHGKWKYSVLYKFNGPDGQWPQGGVILDKSEKHLYGATEYGGAYGYGVVFEITL